MALRDDTPVLSGAAAEIIDLASMQQFERVSNRYAGLSNLQLADAFMEEFLSVTEFAHRDDRIEASKYAVRLLLRKVLDLTPPINRPKIPPKRPLLGGTLERVESIVEEIKRRR